MFCAGDVVLCNFDPQAGHEQGGVRPALILSEEEYNEISTFILLCPITSNIEKQWPFKRILPPNMKTKGAVLVDQIKSVDRNQRVLRYVEKVPDDFLIEVRKTLANIIFTR